MAAPNGHDELYPLFVALREHVVEVIDDFAERVADRIDELKANTRYDAPPLLDVLLSAAAQSFNIAAAIPAEEDAEEEE